MTTFPDLHAAVDQIEQGAREVTVDFSSLERIDPGATRSMEALAAAAEAKAAKVVLQGVNVGVYRVLKLAKLSPRFSFR